MAITQITDHKQAAKDRLLQQYKGKTNVEGFVDGLGGDQIQELEDALFDFFDRLDIDIATGQQLDNIGQIVGQDRLGLADPIYRLFLKAKIGQNVSESEIERVIDVWKLITQANIILLLESFPAQVDLFTDVELPPTLVDAAFELIQNVVGAGIPVQTIGIFDATEAFGFDASGPNTKGFGDDTNPLLGGKLAKILASA